MPLCAAACGGAAPEHGALARGAALLWSRQHGDGGWHSETYGLLRSGQSLTPFVLATLLRVPPDVLAPEPDGVRRAVAFLAARVDDRGAVGLQDELVPDYPNYATALAVQALRAAGQRPDLVARMRAYLRGQQLTEALGWTPADPAYGGWGMGGEPRRAPHHGHLDLSMTRHVIEALGGNDPAVVEPALVFLARCQNADGGFHFTPVIEGANKAGRDADGFRSYGTTTADGILSLLALGVPPDDPRVARARAWLVAHHSLTRVPGFADEPPGGWATGLHYYYLAASARALHLLRVDQAPPGVDWRTRMRNALRQLQADDASWRNWNALVKEDDPLIATTLAVQALAATL